MTTPTPVVDVPHLAFSIDETARQLGVGRTTVVTEISSGRLKSAKIRSRRVVPASALDAYLAERVAEAGQ